MTKRIPTFLAGMFTTALIGSLGVTALAATGQLTISVAPINIQVNGQTFQPKDAQGNSVPVFAYNGTTYAPLRALAEAYGLEVGYDQSKNMATVGGSGGTVPTATPVPASQAPVAPPSGDYSTWTTDEEAAYQEFKGMWEVRDNSHMGEQGVTITADCSKNLSVNAFIQYANSIGDELLKRFSIRYCKDIVQNYSNTDIYFGYANIAVFSGGMVRRNNIGYDYLGFTVAQIEENRGAFEAARSVS